ncbi:amidohydrolase [Dyella sp. ASV21]|uniref:amidohydrolase n=1 Tax=Dyella sp. ASV21 TaxID=2795114 RepID=UPI0018EB3531|nr:amidohydrolase [Dyella sp. ASV21]
MTTYPTLIVHNARIHTGVAHRPEVQALAVTGRRIAAVGTNGQIRSLAGPATVVVDAGKRRVIPGLIDAHLHLVRGGLSYNLELRWDGVPTLDEAMQGLRAQLARTPSPQWVRVVGGFSRHQFAEKRLPALSELNALAPDTPVCLLHLGELALLNQAALRACGYSRMTRDPPGAHFEWDPSGAPTGLLLAAPETQPLYAILAQAPSLPLEYRTNATRHFMRDLNRLGVTSVIDAGGPELNYPDDYQAIEELSQHHLLTVRIAYHLAAAHAGAEAHDFQHWATLIHPGEGDESYRCNGAGEILLQAANDLSNFAQPRPEMAPGMEQELEAVLRPLMARHWPWRLHATYDETIGRVLSLLEHLHAEQPLQAPWWFDHAETVSDHNLQRIARLGGGVCVQPRLAYQGETFAERYGPRAAATSPPLRRMLALGLPVGVGSGGPRMASYDPWAALHWLCTGKTCGGRELRPAEQCVDRATALALYTRANTWFTGEVGSKGQLDVGQLADFAVLSQDYFEVPDDAIPHIVAELTVMDGQVVYASDPFHALDLPPPPALPEWSPVHHGSHCWRPDSTNPDSTTARQAGPQRSVSG